MKNRDLLYDFIFGKNFWREKRLAYKNWFDINWNKQNDQDPYEETENHTKHWHNKMQLQRLSRTVGSFELKIGDKTVKCESKTPDNFFASQTDPRSSKYDR